MEEDQHNHQKFAEVETESTLIITGENYTECKETETLIQITRCEDCMEGLDMVFCIDNGSGEYINLQVPLEAVTNALEQFRQSKTDIKGENFL